ncbi:MAG: bifunctional 2-C-methyl-D-erythritol 4-phosphate cytidylyltransferase/2-C-methyl-D-erythritol [Microbacteriaceae bacterium]|nr:bifunctional 2-C-methyl-D-erythritol 4-phosphate cytidylyltransferase/2-C-methyl-D-erythritol [Microbacteriaceae bacterium]
MSSERATEAVTVAVIVVAAGSGSRLGHELPKALAPLAGRTILQRSLDSIFGMASAAQVIVVAGDGWLDAASVPGTTVVVGGATRQLSVAAGLAALDDGIATVLVHDAARALTPSSLFDEVAAAVSTTGAGVVPALAVVDTIKRVDGEQVTGTVDRSELVAVQTPQGFPRAELTDAYRAATEDHTDDAALYAAAGHKVSVVAGDPLAFKITTPWDLARAEALLRRESSAQYSAGTRTGLGIDVHAWDASLPLWLGGLHWPGEPGLAGHSDGDAVCHAICDALLSAARLGDMGSNFGTDDPQYANASGQLFLDATLALVREAGFDVLNVAVQVVAQRPKVAPRRVEMEARLMEIVGAPVSVSATTSDGLGFTGRGEGLSAMATALLASTSPKQPRR